MKEAFFNLDAEKQERILNAGYKVFAKHRYKQTSTNELVKEAEISKGMLFYYFGSKETMFHDLISEGLKIIKTMYVEEIDTSENDFFERLKQAAVTKWKMTQQHPDVVKFLSHVVMYEPELLSTDERNEITQLTVQSKHALYQNITTDHLRNDLSHDTIIMMIEDLLTGYETRIRNQLTEEMILENNYEALYSSFDEYLETMKILFGNGGVNND